MAEVEADQNLEHEEEESGKDKTESEKFDPDFSQSNERPEFIKGDIKEVENNQDQFKNDMKQSHISFKPKESESSFAKMNQPDVARGTPMGSLHGQGYMNGYAAEAL